MPAACPNIAITGGADLTHKNITWRWAAIFMVHSYALHTTLENSRLSVYKVEFLPSRVNVPKIGTLMVIMI
jgi:hypothetical protein